jgi:hypothetical protein
VGTIGAFASIAVMTMMRAVVVAPGIVGATAEKECGAEKSDGRGKFTYDRGTKVAPHAGSNPRGAALVAIFFFAKVLRPPRAYSATNASRRGSMREDGHALEYLLRHPGCYHLGSRPVAKRAEKVAGPGEIRNFLVAGIADPGRIRVAPRPTKIAAGITDPGYNRSANLEFINDEGRRNAGGERERTLEVLAGRGGVSAEDVSR